MPVLERRIQHRCDARHTQPACLFEFIVQALTGFCVDNLSPDERTTLADKLQDPSLTFASPLAEEMVPEIVSALLD